MHRPFEFRLRILIKQPIIVNLKIKNVRKLKLLLSTAAVLGMFFVTSCKKTTNNNTVVQDSIYYSTWTPLSMQFDATDSVYYEDFSNKALTASVLSHGAVLGYLGYVNSSGDTIAESPTDFSSYGVGQVFGVGAIEIFSPYPNDLTYNASQGYGYLYRYVIIPANVLSNTSLSNLTQQQLNKMNFTDIQKALQAGQSGAGNKVTIP